MNIQEVIKNRRSIRKFKDDPIADDILKDILKSSLYAPTPGNGQAFRFGIVKDPNRKYALAKAAGNQMWLETAPVLIACCAVLDEDMNKLPEDDFSFVVNQTRFSKAWLDHLMAFDDRFMSQIFWSNGTPTIPGHHIILSATAHGIGSCWVGYLDVLKASEILKLPKTHACLFLIPLGYADEVPEEKDLKDYDQMIFSECWEETND